MKTKLKSKKIKWYVIETKFGPYISPWDSRKGLIAAYKKSGIKILKITEASFV